MFPTVVYPSSAIVTPQGVPTRAPPAPARSERERAARRLRTSQMHKALEESYRAKPYPLAPERLRLAELFDVPHRQVRVWFQNRRQRELKKRRLAELCAAVDTEPSEDRESSSVVSSDNVAEPLALEPREHRWLVGRHACHGRRERASLSLPALGTRLATGRPAAPPARWRRVGRGGSRRGW
jgi:hypothetical protein